MSGGDDSSAKRCGTPGGIQRWLQFVCSRVVRRAASVSGPISNAVGGSELEQAGLDELLVQLNGTDGKSRPWIQRGIGGILGFLSESAKLWLPLVAEAD